MKKEKICITRQAGFLLLIIIILSLLTLFINNLSSQKKITSSKASEYNKCGPSVPCPATQYCLDHQGDSQECVTSIDYALSIATPETGTFSNGKTYKYSGDAVYEYKSGVTAKLSMNKEYSVHIEDPYPGERWDNATTVSVSVTGLSTKPITMLDPVNYPKDWRSKSVIFTTGGQGSIIVSLKRVDPSNQRVLTRNWTIDVEVTNPSDAYYKCGSSKPCPSTQYCLNHQGDSTECVNDIAYALSLAKPATGNYSNGKTYKYSGDAVYEYKSGVTAKLDMNKEYALHIQDPYPGEWWEDAYTVNVTVSGLTTKEITTLDPVNYPKDWRSKSLTFTSSGKGTMTVNLNRIDPSNKKMLTKTWILNVEVTNPSDAYYKCGSSKPCPSTQYCLNHQGDSTECVNDIAYALTFASPETGTYSSGKTYKYAGDTLYTYTAGKTAYLYKGTEYALHIQDPYPGEWWKDAYTVNVTVSGLTAKTITALDPVNYPDDWRSKSITFTSTGNGKVTVNLRRTDPSNQKVLTKSWTMDVSVSDNSSME